LVQEVGRLWQQQLDEPEPNELEPALRWLNAAFVGNPQDVRSWAVLDPLAPHAKALVGFADQAGITDQTVRLISQLGSLLFCKAAYSDAEPLMARVVEIFEISLGNDHPNVAAALNNLAQLLQDTNRLAEAERLMQRALAIDEANYGNEHPDVARDLNNLAGLLQATNRLLEAEPLMRRALAIDEASYGNDNPKVARDLNNLAGLLQATNRLAEAEPLMRRMAEILIAFSQQGFQHPNLETGLGIYFSLLKALGLPESEIQARLQSLQPQP
jgi:tetratricopeptide (TPR) repeat protein